MTDNDYIAAITPQVYQRFKTAVELGKWPDGNKLTDEQRATCIQAIITYEYVHLPDDQRTGYMPTRGCPSKNNEQDKITWQDQ